ncbi:MAG: GDSL-type esterase/lipase family protein [Gemmatimonadota bacterium]|nr:GDSL-type esterase/lipase family protein [Gemmatimonadota bacterium]
MTGPSPIRFHRYVAIGDSSTEGLDDPDGRGHFRGWADRLAEQVAVAQGGLHYANLAVRGRRTRQVLEDQLNPALALAPDLVTIFTGTNDVVSRRFDPEAIRRDLAAMHHPLVDSGATVLTFTLPDLSPIMPLARLLGGRIATLNDVVRQVAAEAGVILLDFARIPTTTDPRLWSADRFHANSAGHTRIAAALALALGLPGADPDWAAPLPGSPPSGVTSALRAEGRWIRDHFLPWVVRHLQGRSSGDGVHPKRPELEWILPGDLERSRAAPASDRPDASRCPGGRGILQEHFCPAPHYPSHPGGSMRFRYAIVFVTDLDVSIRFYRDLVGLPLREESRTAAEFDVGDTTFALHAAHVDDPQHHHPPMLAGSCRLGFAVDDLDATHRRLVEAGVRCRTEPETSYDNRVALYEDPDGMNFTLAQRQIG